MHNQYGMFVTKAMWRNKMPSHQHHSKSLRISEIHRNLIHPFLAKVMCVVCAGRRTSPLLNPRTHGQAARRHMSVSFVCWCTVLVDVFSLYCTVVSREMYSSLPRRLWYSYDTSTRLLSQSLIHIFHIYGYCSQGRL